MGAAIGDAALRNRNTSFVIDGEAVLGVDGISVPQVHDEMQFYAFDILAKGGEDHRKLSLSMPKINLVRLLARRVDGIFQRLRAGRDRPRPVPLRLPDGTGRAGFQAPRAAAIRQSEFYGAISNNH